MAKGRFDMSLGTHIDDASGTVWAPGVGWVRGAFLYEKGGRPVPIDTLPEDSRKIAKDYSDRAKNIAPGARPPTPPVDKVIQVPVMTPTAPLSPQTPVSFTPAMNQTTSSPEDSFRTLIRSLS